MSEIEQHGWRADLVGELDHRRLKAPAVKLRSARKGPFGEVVWCVDLRVRRPNADEYLTTAEAHSLEHFLLEGLQRLLPKNFVSVGVMGCRTGFYLIFANEGRAATLCATLVRIFTEMARATEVPYANIEQCGNWRDHSLERAQSVAREILAGRPHWLDAA